MDVTRTQTPETAAYTRPASTRAAAVVALVVGVAFVARVVAEFVVGNAMAAEFSRQCLPGSGIEDNFNACYASDTFVASATRIAPGDVVAVTCLVGVAVMAARAVRFVGVAAGVVTLGLALWAVLSYGYLDGLPERLSATTALFDDGRGIGWFLNVGKAISVLSVAGAVACSALIVASSVRRARLFLGRGRAGALVGVGDHARFDVADHAHPFVGLHLEHGEVAVGGELGVPHRDVLDVLAVLVGGAGGFGVGRGCHAIHSRR